MYASSPSPSTHVAAIALGSNLGDRKGFLRQGVERVRALGEVLAVSSFHDTAPVGFLDQPRFLNAALLLRTELPARELLRELLAIEAALGRRRENVAAKGPRTLDLDLLLYDDAVLAEPGLTVPHPGMAQRRFVLEPLAEIAPEWVHPVLQRSIRDLLTTLPPERNQAE